MQIHPLIDPYAVYQDGSRPLTANWDVGGFDITNIDDLGVEGTGIFGDLTTNLPISITNHDFSNGSAGWDAASGWIFTGGVASCGPPDDGGSTRPEPSLTIVVGYTYKIVFTQGGGEDDIVTVGLGGASYPFSFQANGVKTCYLTAVNAGNLIFTYTDIGGGGITVDDVSVTRYGTITVGRLTLADGLITDESGAISFGDEDLTTTGDISAANLTASSLTATRIPFVGADGILLDDGAFKWDDTKKTLLIAEDSIEDHIGLDLRNIRAANTANKESFTLRLKADDATIKLALRIEASFSDIAAATTDGLVHFQTREDGVFSPALSFEGHTVRAEHHLIVGNETSPTLTLDKTPTGTSQIKFNRAATNDWYIEHDADENLNLVGIGLNKDFTININDGGVQKDVFVIDSSVPSISLPNVDLIVDGFGRFDGGVGVNIDPLYPLHIVGSSFPVGKIQRTTTVSTGVYSAMGIALKKTNGNPAADFSTGFIVQAVNDSDKICNIAAFYGNVESWVAAPADAGTGGWKLAVFNNSFTPTVTLSGTSNGNIRAFNWLKVGADADPAATLDVAGDALISTTLGVTGLITATGGVTIGAAGGLAMTTNDLTLTTASEKTLVLSQPVYKDINMAGYLLTKPAASAPSVDTFVDENGADTTIETYAFAVDEKVHGGFELQHDYKEGTDLVFHVHWQGKAAPSGTDNVQWRLNYIVMRDDTTLNAAVVIDSPDTAIDTQYKAYRTDFAAITGTNFLIGDQFMFTLIRVAATGDAYAGEALIGTAGIHCQLDTIGSRQITTK